MNDTRWHLFKLGFCIIVPLTLSQLKDQDPPERSPDPYLSEAYPLSLELASWLHALADTRLRPAACSQLVLTHS